MAPVIGERGNLFLYACISQLYSRLRRHCAVELDAGSVDAAENEWNMTDESLRHSLRVTADAFIDGLFSAETLILGSDEPVTLSVSENGSDIIIAKGACRRDVVLSVKKTYLAADHSRLSATLDVGEKWYGIPCSDTYWKSVKRIYDEMRQVRKEYIPWRKVANPIYGIYRPLLLAFKKEFERAYAEDKSMLKRAMSYILGVNDLYEDDAPIKMFRLRGERLSSGRRYRTTFFVPAAALPAEMVELRWKFGCPDTLELFTDNGWAMAFIVHNASAFVEPVLDMDILFMSMPDSVIAVEREE